MKNINIVDVNDDSVSELEKVEVPKHKTIDLNKYKKYLIKNSYSKTTIESYINVLKQFNAVFYDIRKIKEKLLDHLDQPNTINTYYNIVLAYMKFAKDKRLSQMEELKLPPITQKFMPVFSKNFLYKKTEDISCKKSLIVRFLFETGIRVSELSKIIEIKKDTLLVKGKGNKNREIFHNPETTKRLTHHWDAIKKTHSKSLRIWVKEILGDEYTPHSIRRSHATHMLLSGADPKTVMLQLGHSNIETTYRYLHMSKEKNLKIYKKHF